MTTTVSHDHQQAVQAASSATAHLHRAEIALHDAHTSHVDAWILAASDKLHENVLRYEQAQHALAAFASVAA